MGDGILTYFGWPTAHEEDAERAALEIVHTVKRASSPEVLSVRIGIAAGPVVVGEPAVNPTLKAFLAEAMALTGEPDNALQLINELIGQVECLGEVRLSYADILRLKSWVLSLKGDLEGAERNFLFSLDWARRQQAKSW
jgi:hypothetical protein